MVVFITLFAIVMAAGALCVVFKSGEKEGICQYGYLDEDNED